MAKRIIKRPPRVELPGVWRRPPPEQFTSLAVTREIRDAAKAFAVEQNVLTYELTAAAIVEYIERHSASRPQAKRARA